MSLFLGNDEEQAPRRPRATWAAALRRIRNLAIPVTLTALSAVLLVTAIGSIYSAVTRRSVAVAAGRPDSEAYSLIEALKKVSSRGPAKVDLKLLAPGSDSENLQRLNARDAGLAVAGSDIAPVPTARSVAVLYGNLGHVLVQKDSGIARFPDLKGKRIGLPQAGDDYRVFLALAKVYNLGESDFIFAGGDQDSSDATFVAKETAAVFRLRSAGSPYIKRIIAATGARLLPLGDGSALGLLSTGYEAANIPKGTYQGDPPVPSEDTPTVATRRVLYARRDLDTAVVFDLVGILLQHRAELAASLPNEAKDLRQLATAARRPPTTGFDAAIHPGVDAFYRASEDRFGVRYAFPVVLLLAGLLIAATAVLEWRRSARRQQKFELDRYNSRVVDLMDKSNVDRPAIRENLQALQLQAIQALNHDKLSPEGFDAFQSVWTAAMRKTQKP